MTIKQISKYVTVGALFLIPIFPLIVANSYFFPFITGKAFYFRILVELAFASWIILAFVDAKYRPKLSPLNIAISVFAIVALFADLLGVNPVRSLVSNFERMEGWLVIVHLWMFFVVISSTLGSGEIGRRMWNRWFNFSVLIALIIAVYGVLQLLEVVPTHQGSRVDATLGNAAYMAVYMLMHAGIAAYMFFVARAKKIANSEILVWVYPILAILFGFIVVSTATRGTTLGLIGGVILACAIYAIFGKGEKKNMRWLSVGVIATIVLIGAIFWTQRNSEFVKKYEVLNRMASISWTNTSGQARQLIWPVAISGALERPILGWGQENFNYIFNANYNPKMWSQEQWFDRAHSVYLDWFVASGFLGLFAYLALYITLLYVIWKSDLSIAKKSVLIGLLAAYAVHNIFVFDNLASYVFFFALLAFGNSLHEGKYKHIFGDTPAKKDVVEYVVAPIVLVLLVGTLYYATIRPAIANTRLITAIQACSNARSADAKLFDKALAVGSYMANQEIREQVFSCAGNVLRGDYPNVTQRAFLELADAAIQAQIAASPKDTRTYMLGGSFMNAIGQFPMAAEYLEKGMLLSPKKQSLIMELANSYINLGKNEDAVKILRDAYISAPENTTVKNAYATVMVLDGKEAQARIEFKDQPELFETDIMVRAYTQRKEYNKAIPVLKNLIKKDPTNIQMSAYLAQLQFQAGMKSAAIETLRAIAKDNPTLKDQVEAAISEMQKR